MKKKASAFVPVFGVLLRFCALGVSSFGLRFGMRTVGRVASHQKTVCPHCQQEVSALEIQITHSCPHCGEKIDAV